MIMSRNQKALALAFLAFVASIGFIVLARMDRQNQEDVARSHANTKVGSPATNIIGDDIDGKEFKLSDYRGKVVMLDFWGFW